MEEVKKFNMTKFKLILKALLCFLLVIVIAIGTILFTIKGGISVYGAELTNKELMINEMKLKLDGTYKYGLVYKNNSIQDKYSYVLSTVPIEINYISEGDGSPGMKNDLPIKMGWVGTDGNMVYESYTTTYVSFYEIVYSNHDIYKTLDNENTVFFSPTILNKYLSNPQQTKPIISTMVSLVTLLLPLLIGYLALRKGLATLRQMLSQA